MTGEPYYITCPFCGWETVEYFCGNCLRDIDEDSETYGKTEDEINES